VITALNGLTVYSARLQAHPVASYGIRAHFLSTAIKSQTACWTYGGPSQTSSSTLQFERDDLSQAEMRMDTSSEWTTDPLRICLSPLSSYCLSVRPFVRSPNENVPWLFPSGRVHVLVVYVKTIDTRLLRKKQFSED